jgi:hypothetical protein
MNSMLKRGAVVSGVVVGLAVLGAAVAGQEQRPAAPVRPAVVAPKYVAPRLKGTPHPDLNGLWQSITTAYWDIQDHSAQPGPAVTLGAWGAEPAGQGIVEGNDIPYQDWARKQKQQNYDNRMKVSPLDFSLGDPELKCYLPGVPRANYLPFPFQIIQSTNQIVVSYEFADATRLINMGTHERPPIDSFMGWSNGRWEGDTLVVEVTDFNGKSWLDRAGNFHSESMKLVERYTPVSPDHLQYEATIEDPKVFTRPWKISFPLYRRKEARAQRLEFKCVEFVEELIYGTLTKKPTASR